MTVLHHAFRCPVTPALKRKISNLLAAWEVGDREKVSAMALARYAALAGREDIHAAFYLAPEGAAPSWLEPQFISPGLAALVVLAESFISLPSLSASYDTNHYQLATLLPAFGWSVEDVTSLVNGQPIETMLRAYSRSVNRLEPGGFRHTGGWTAPGLARELSMKLDRLAFGPPAAANDAAHMAWNRLNESKALDDARQMLAPLRDEDWLVMAITH